jgi:hypothetical protein
MSTLVIVLLVLFVLGGGGWGYSLVGAASANRPTRLTMLSDPIFSTHGDVRLRE